MSQIDELISKLQEVSNHPQKTVLNYKKQDALLRSGRNRIRCRLPPGRHVRFPEPADFRSSYIPSSVRLFLDAG